MLTSKAQYKNINWLMMILNYLYVHFGAFQLILIYVIKIHFIN